jgi:ATP-dependent RNA helicase DeaD
MSSDQPVDALAAQTPNAPPAAAGAGGASAPGGALGPDGPPGFRELGLFEPLLLALKDLGYETPTPIQARTIPHLLAGRDVLGQAQTGTGKTAAFALPVLGRIDLSKRTPQALVLTPTRELAIQVAEAFQRYAVHLTGFHVLPIYGGQGYAAQLRSLDRGVHVVVGTPGRVMDHMRRGTLRLEDLTYLVLDEADEMLRMGFLEDVTWILEQTPATRKTALFSATLPEPVRRIAQRQMRTPVEVTIETHAATAALIRQRFWIVSGTHKLDALTRILEVEDVDGMLVFVRTKTETVDLAERLEARGFACAPLSGDVPQPIRERTIDRFKEGGLDILVATDVAARGLDVDRVSHVINFDVPTDTESYVHRIGRTGRAGRSGDAIIFISPRERHMLHAIERMIGKRIDQMSLPTAKEVNEQRIGRFKKKIAATLEKEDDLSPFLQIVAEFAEEHEVDALNVAAALAKMAQGTRPLLMEETAPPARDDGRGGPRSGGFGTGTETFRIEVGLAHGLRPGNIVGAIANESGLDGRRIGRIEIHDDYSTVDLPTGMPDELFEGLRRVRVCGQELRLTRVPGTAAAGPRARPQGRPQGGPPDRPHRGPPGRRDDRPHPRKAGKRPPRG